MIWSHRTFKIFIVLCISSSSHAWFSYDKAAYAAQSEQWLQAMQSMKEVVNNNPNDPQVLYDAGVAAYRNKDFTQAQAYFHQASVACNADTLPLQEHAYFNEGNALAHLQRYQEAITSYEKALTCNADNQQAQENSALLKKLLEQKQQEEKNKDQQKNNDNNQQDQDDNQDSPQQQKERDKQDQHDNQQQENQDQSSDSPENESDNKRDENHHNNEQSPPQQQQQDQQRQRKQEQQKQSQEAPQGQSPQHQAQQSCAGNATSDVQSDKQEHAPHEVSAWLDAVLSEREKQDEAVNKALIKMQTAQQPQGSHNATAHNW